MDGRFVLVYDAECPFCEGWARWLARVDTQGRFRFSSRGADYGRRLLADRPELRAIDSVIFVAPGHVYVRSDAAIRAAVALGGAWRAVAILLLVPRFLRDAVYRGVALVRRRLARNACGIGPGLKELRERTLP
ncbi:MAG TPA: DCC1-like thiol-disulfide oxidoreductase family protein [Vicinamibacterales bacterium]|nr:DCC1-like thiol-disulfide oxidoreductase family protein [Vicinamibacterales bacterium]